MKQIGGKKKPAKVKKPVKKVSKKPAPKPVKKPAAAPLKKVLAKPVRIVSKATRKKMSLAHQGKKLSPETRQKIRDAKAERKKMVEMGLISPYQHTPETRKKLSRIMKKKKHKPTDAAIRKSAQSRSATKQDRRLARKIMKGEW